MSQVTARAVPPAAAISPATRGRPLGVDVEHSDPGPLPPVAQADRPADAVVAASTGDYRYFATQTTGRPDRVSHAVRLSPVLALE